MTTTHYAVVKKPGHRDHEMSVISAHMTPEAARRAAAKDKTTEVVKTVAPTAKKAKLWDDAIGRSSWSAI